MKNVLFLSLSCIGFIIFNSCSDEEPSTQKLEGNAISHYKLTKSGERSLKDNSYLITEIQTSNEQYNTLLEKTQVNVDTVEKTVTFFHSEEEGSITYSLEESEQGLYELVEPDMKYGMSRKIPRWMCGGLCVGAGFALTMVDGPAPFADMYAIGFTIGCV